MAPPHISYAILKINPRFAIQHSATFSKTSKCISYALLLKCSKCKRTKYKEATHGFYFVFPLPLHSAVEVKELVCLVRFLSLTVTLRDIPILFYTQRNCSKWKYPNIRTLCSHQPCFVVTYLKKRYIGTRTNPPSSRCFFIFTFERD